MRYLNEKIKICIISSQILGFGKIGGFGSMTKKLADSLAGKGYDVTVVIPKKAVENPSHDISGVTILSLNFLDIINFKKIFRSIDADIYHSQNPNFFTTLALFSQPQKKHVITCRDPRDTYDWIVEIMNATWKRRLKTPLVYLFEGGPFISYAVKKADVIGCPAYFLIEKVMKMYGRKDIILLPNIEKIPDIIPPKAKKPTVCFVGRLDRRKRPELVFQLAEKFPCVQFFIVGKAENQDRDAQLKNVANKLKNVHMLGYIDKFQSSALEEIYAKSWILVNTSAREGLPITFIEAAGQGCAILSTVDPDGFATKYGYFADSIDKLSEGLEFLLKDTVWKEKGKAGFEYVSLIYREENALKVYLDLYQSLLSR